MSVLVKGMKMPESCLTCNLLDWDGGYRCWVTQVLVGKILRNGERSADCPLIEIPPHGDLIDRKALLADTTDMIHSMMVFGGARVYTSDAIKNAHTVIPAEEES